METPRVASDVRPPPQTVWGILKSCGPGLIITANIVGTGELIATTKLGSEVGFTLLWFIILSCFIKVFVQVELGRYAVSEGISTLEAMNRLPGPRAIASWLIWLYLVMYVGTLLQAAGIVGAIAKLFAAAPLPVSRTAWAAAAAGSCAILLVLGWYRLVEWGSTFMVVVFTFCTVGAVAALAWTPYRIGAGDVATGMAFHLPSDLFVAFAAFGITGVGAGELIYYPYWCLEKGYARHVGPRDDTPEWAARARGWLRVMTVDAWLSFAVYTMATVSFYLLGAAVLHPQGLKVDNADFVASLSRMYEAVFGPAAGWWIFLVGAFMVLYSTLFVSTASNSRMACDVAPLVRLLRYPTEAHRRQAVRIGVVAIPVFLFSVQLVGEPVTLVLIGGVAQAMMLPFLAMLALVFRHRWSDVRLRPGAAWTVFLWISFLAMTALGVYNVTDTGRKLLPPAAPAAAPAPGR
jgi:manganese transport protein